MFRFVTLGLSTYIFVLSIQTSITTSSTTIECLPEPEGFFDSVTNLAAVSAASGVAALGAVGTGMYLLATRRCRVMPTATGYGIIFVTFIIIIILKVCIGLTEVKPILYL